MLRWRLLICAGAFTPPGRFPGTRKAYSRVKYYQCKSGYHNQWPLENQKCGLVVGQFTAKPAMKFSNTIYTTNENRNNG
jgi:hypothetical protein